MSDSTPNTTISSGKKFRTEHGFAAIKDGIKQRRQPDDGGEGSVDPGRKPKWLRAQIPGGERFEAVKRNVSEHRLSTVCAESHCPNMGECWSNGTATIMLMGSV
ncbi:MAG TPA: lipoyl synthase, partial [Halomonas sp.]|nr:lipoyl synthase [Halomonas sp.]